MGAVMAIIYVIYMVAVGNSSVSHILGFMMAMGNTYGVVLISVLMGNGLVAIPKRLWMMVDAESELQSLYLSVTYLCVVRLVKVGLSDHCCMLLPLFYCAGASR
jgi:hypothetical protein